MTEAESNGAELYCSFSIGMHCFGIHAKAVREVHTPVPLTPIPGSPPAVLGYANLRGHLHLVLDPGELLLRAPISVDDSAGMIVFRPEVGEAFAIAVERIGEILSIPRGEIHVPKARADDIDLSDTDWRSESLVAGHATLDPRLVTLIDPAKLLEAAFAESTKNPKV